MSCTSAQRVFGSKQAKFYLWPTICDLGYQKAVALGNLFDIHLMNSSLITTY